MEDKPLSRKEKGRYKKLRKKAAAVQNKLEISGITATDDWREFQEIHAKAKGDQTYGPSIVWRNGKALDRIEGSDNRDILHRLIAITTETKKRKLEADDLRNTKIPSWVTMHNPISAEHVGVLELHFPTQNVQWELSLKETLVSLGEKNLRNVLQTETRWFQGPQPQSITRTLMYASVDNKFANKKKKGLGVQNKEDLYEELLSLCLTSDSMEKEKYPRAESKGTPVEDDTLESLAKGEVSEGKPLDISLDDARKIVKNLAVPVTESRNDAEGGLPPYVKSVLQCPSTRKPRVFAIDCEMVQTTFGKELARVTVVQLESFTRGHEIVTKQVLDKVVKPTHPVVDYLTHYSGMTRDILDNTDVFLEQVQLLLLCMIREDDILVGHSLENDLRALRFVHSRIVDTAILLRPSNGRFKYSLRTLAARLLGLQIQRSDKAHCSEEDALTALKLAARRAIEGPSFKIPDKSQTNKLPLLASLGVSVCVGPSRWLEEHVTTTPNSIHALSCETIKDRNHKAVSSWLTGPSRRAKLVWAQWHLNEADKTETNTIEGLLSDLMGKLPRNAVLLVLVQPGFKEAERLTRVRRARQSPKTTAAWTERDENEWARAVEASRLGSTFWISTK